MKLNPANKNLLITIFESTVNFGVSEKVRIIGKGLKRHYNGYAYYFRLYRKNKLTGEADFFDSRLTEDEFFADEHLYDYYINETESSKIKIDDWSFKKLSISNNLTNGFFSGFLVN